MTWILATGIAFASGEIDIPVDQVTIKSTKLKIEVAVERMPGGKSTITATYDGKDIPIPKSVIAGFGSIHPQSVHILTHVPAGEIPDGWLKRHPFIISFDYGDSKEHGRDDHEVTVAVILAVAFAVIVQPGGDGILGSTKTPDGSEYVVEQNCNWSVEPYTVSFYMRSPSGKWGWLRLTSPPTDPPPAFHKWPHPREMGSGRRRGGRNRVAREWHPGLARIEVRGGGFP